MAKAPVPSPIQKAHKPAPSRPSTAAAPKPGAGEGYVEVPRVGGGTVRLFGDEAKERAVAYWMRRLADHLDEGSRSGRGRVCASSSEKEPVALKMPLADLVASLEAQLGQDLEGYDAAEAKTSGEAIHPRVWLREMIRGRFS